MLPILSLAFLLAGLQARPAVRSDAAGTVASIQGEVVRAGAIAAAAPTHLPDARVELKPGNASVFTDANGVFNFRNIVPGKYTISVKHDGFVLQEDRQHGLSESGLSISVGAGQALKNIVLPMIPSPVISGTVFDPHGEPLAAALVRTYVRQYLPYGTRLKPLAKAMTNDFGEFRLFGLNFGEYFVSAAYGDRDRAVAVGKTQLSPNVAKADDGYAAIFYDGGEDISRAQPIRLAPGLATNALNVYLRDPARFKIRGQVLPAIPGTKILFAPKGSDLTESTSFTQPNAGGAFEIRGVSPGPYVLIAMSDDGSYSSEVISVSVIDRDIEQMRVAMAQTISISGTVSLEGTPRARLPGLHVRLLRGNAEFDQRIDTAAGPDGSFVFEHVPQADYDIAVEPLPAGTYVKAINSGLRNFFDARSRLLQNQQLQIVLGTAPDSLDVQVVKGSEPAAGIQVALIPEPLLRRRADRYITGFTDESGRLRFNSVPPGRYTAYAFEQIEKDAYYALAYSPEAENRFRDRSVSVTVGENGTKAIQLRAISAAETAGGLQ
jgi:hypothetical protein